MRPPLILPLAAAAALALALPAGCSANESSEGGPKDPGAAGSGAGAPGSTGGSTITWGGGRTDAGSPTDVNRQEQPVTIDECLPANPAGLDAATVQTLQAGSGSPGSMRVLYPYDGTVFPGGLISPTLMWEGGLPDAVYLHLSSQLFDYKGCFVPTGPGQLHIPQPIWDQAIAQTNGASDPLRVELSTLGGGRAMGPVALGLTLTRAKMKGSIFYNTYTSPMALSQGYGSGVVMRIPPGRTAEVFLGVTTPGECVGCHAVSANGVRMTAERHGLGGTIYVDSMSYALDPSTPPNPPPLATGIPKAGFSGFYPDGTRFLTTSRPCAGGPMCPGNVIGTYGPDTAHLYDTDSGMELPNSGIPGGAKMPMFSPDGTLLTFTDHAIGGDGKGLAVMDFDAASNQATGYREIFSTPTHYPGWPFFLPDNSGVIFALGTDGNYVSEFGGINPVSDIHVIDLSTNTPIILARAMGFNSIADAQANNTYLPFGAEDLHKNFFPTVSPVAAGGYFWVFFTSRRHYGNTPTPLGHKQIWVAAVDVSADGVAHGDGSHPAFYLPGQEIDSGNVRAFAALDPCRSDGGRCETGVDCCGGACLYSEAVGDKICGQPQSCSEEDGKCSTSSDCCESHLLCIAGFCSRATVQ